MSGSGQGWLPVERPVVGLISCYVAGGTVLSLPVSWLAVIDGAPPELRAGCSAWDVLGQVGGRAFDFAVNIHGDARQSFAATPGERPERCQPLPARLVDAPLLAGFPLQIECSGGRWRRGDWETELAGDIRLLHRGGIILDPADYPSLTALRPLRVTFPS